MGLTPAKPPSASQLEGSPRLCRLRANGSSACQSRDGSQLVAASAPKPQNLLKTDSPPGSILLSRSGSILVSVAERPDTSPLQGRMAFAPGTVARDMRSVFGRSQPSASSESFRRLRSVLERNWRQFVTKLPSRNYFVTGARESYRDRRLPLSADSRGMRSHRAGLRVFEILADALLDVQGKRTKRACELLGVQAGQPLLGAHPPQ